jgi:Fe-S cluster biogenesis protein NfuA
MTERTQEEIENQIKDVLEEYVKPAVAGHGGDIEFISYEDGHLLLELKGACSGCAGSTMTLKMGVENMVRHFVPEVQSIQAMDDPFSTVDPFYNDPFMFNEWETINIEDISNDPDNK